MNHIKNDDTHDRHAVMEHIPVLLKEVVHELRIMPDGVYVDGTLGAAGHSLAIAVRLNGDGTLIAMDRDEQSCIYGQEVLDRESISQHIIHRGSFEDIADILKEHEFDGIDGAIIDLGWNMDQFRDGERGFSFQERGPLDMRYDQRQVLTAADIINFTSPEGIAQILYNYSDERFSQRIADAIATHRKVEGDILFTDELADIVKGAIPRKFHNRYIHPATKTFQALRIATNDEYGHIERGVPALLSALNVGARLLIISFHSGEDRIVKRLFKNMEEDSQGAFMRVYKKGITPSFEEVSENPRARSARLRIMQHMGDLYNDDLLEEGESFDENDEEDDSWK